MSKRLTPKQRFVRDSKKVGERIKVEFFANLIFRPKARYVKIEIPTGLAISLISSYDIPLEQEAADGNH